MFTKHWHLTMYEDTEIVYKPRNFVEENIRESHKSITENNLIESSK